MPPKFNPPQNISKSPAQALQEKILSADTLLTSRGLSRQEIQMTPPEIKIAWGRAQDFFKQRIQPNDFMSVPGMEGTVKDANRYVTSREKEFSLDREKVYADVLEAVISDEINKKHWFGKNATRVLTSSYDDYKNGADLAVEMQGRETPVPHPVLLSMDVTYSDNPVRIGQKLEKAFEKLRNGTLGEITFYKNSQFTGSVRNVPIVTVGVSKVVIDDLAKKWVDKEKRAELDNHFAQRIILEQAQAQLSAFSTFLSKHPETPNRDTMFEIIERDKKLLALVLQEKESILLGKGSQDPVYTQILTLSRKIASL